MTDKELMQEVLEAMESLHRTGDTQVFDMCAAPVLIPVLRERLAQPEQEPVAWMNPSWANPDTQGWASESFKSAPIDGWTPLYTTPPQRKPLPPQSPCEMTQAERKMFKLGWLECEAAHGIKENT